MPALILALGLSAVAAAPLLYPGFFHNHAGLLPAYQAAALGPLGWTPVAGLPPAAPLPHAAVALLQLVGLDPAASIKLIHGSALLLGPAGAFLAGTTLTRMTRPGRPPRQWLGGLVAAVVYAFLPFRLAATYVRGDLGEALALALLPWLIFVALGPGRVVALAAGALTLALCQPALAVGGLGAALALRWGVGARFERVATLAAAAGLAIGLATWLPTWLGPARPGTPDLVQPAHFFLSRWGYAASPASGMPIHLGVVALGGGLVGIVAGEASPRVRWALAAMVLPPAVLALAGPWWGPLLPIFGQPWQAVGVAALGLALATALLPLPEHREATAVAVALALVALVASWGFLQPTKLAALSRGEPVLAVFGDRVALLSMQRSGTRSPDAFLLDWQALADGVEDYGIHLQVSSTDGRPVANWAQAPLDGVRPTAGWAKGEVIRDRVALPDALPPGVYRVAVSLVREGNGERLPVRGRDGRTAEWLVLGEVTVP